MPPLFPDIGLDSRPKKCARLLRHEDAMFPSFERVAGQIPRYRVGGIAAGKAMVGATSARDVWIYYSKQASSKFLGRHIIHDHTEWTKEFGFAWNSDLNYPTFLKAWKGEEPILFYKAVQVIAAFEAATIALGGGNIYEVMDIIPCSYNVDRFNRKLLERLRQVDVGNGGTKFDAGALIAMRQPEAELLDRLAEGECVTRESAKDLRRFAKEFIEQHNLNGDFEVGEMRAYPGGKRLGTRKASELERVDTDSKRP